MEARRVQNLNDLTRKKSRYPYQRSALSTVFFNQIVVLLLLVDDYLIACVQSLVNSHAKRNYFKHKMRKLSFRGILNI